MNTTNTIVGQLERKTQNRIVKSFQDKLGYEYRRRATACVSKK